MKNIPKATKSSVRDREPAFQSDPAGSRILLYTDCAGIYGAAQCNHQLLCALARSGYRVMSAQFREETHLIEHQREIGIEHFWLQEDNLYDRSHIARALTDDTEARQIFGKAMPDLVIFANGSPMSNLKAMQAAAGLGLAYLVIVHCVAPEWADQYRHCLAALPDIFLRAREVVAVSRDNLASLQKLFGLPSSMGRVIYNGRPDVFFRKPSPHARASVRRELNIPADAVVSVTAARFEFAKGHDLQIMAGIKLLRASAESNLYFVWAGRGSLEKRLRFLAGAMAISARIRFVGERVDMVDLFDAGDMFILPSRYEGMPLSLIEAMAKGLPVAASAVSGNPEALGETGVLLPDPNLDAGATIEAMAVVLDRWSADAAVRHTAGQRCRRRAEQNFRLAPMLRQYEELIQKHCHGQTK